MVRLYIDTESLAEEDGVELTDLDIVSFKIYEGASREGTFNLIDTVVFNPHVTYIETEEETSDTHWFKVSYIDSQAVESELSEPILGENVYKIIETVATALGDIDRDTPETMAFTDDEYVLKIKEALKYHSGAKSITGVEEADLSMLILLVRISCCYDLAYDNAKYTRISLPDGISIDKGQRVQQYLSIARQLEARYEQMKKGWQGDEGDLLGTPSAEITEFSRKPYFNATRFRSGTGYFTRR